MLVKTDILSFAYEVEHALQDMEISAYTVSDEAGYDVEEVHILATDEYVVYSIDLYDDGTFSLCVHNHGTSYRYMDGIWKDLFMYL